MRAKKAKGSTPGKPDTYPLAVTSGSVTVKVYRVVNRERPMFTVSYIEGDAGRKLLQFRDPEKAKAKAHQVAKNLSAGDLQALRMTGADRASLAAAERELQPLGASVVTASHAYAEAFRILGGDRIVEAARFYAAKANTSLPLLTVADAVKKYAEAKQHEGISRHYTKDIRLMLTNGLAGAFRCNLSSVTSDDLRAYLAAKKFGSVAKDNHRRVIVAFFNHAKESGWLAKNESTAADALKPFKSPRRDVEIYTPDEVARLLAHAETDFVPWIALIAFGGVRNEELAKGLDWSAIDFAKGRLIVPEAIAKTARKRKIDFTDNLLAWLAPYRGKTGPIFETKSYGRIEKTAEAAGVKWKRNALRHSFGSYRMESVKNAGQVSLEMGNSPAVVLKHYHEIVDASDAAAYWSITPESAKNVVPMGRKTA
jgi:integrase